MKFANSKAKLVVILGPTSSGKTGLAEALCRQFNGFIIAADSRQIYRYLDIGTGKAETVADLESLKKQRQKLLSDRHIKPDEYKIRINEVENYMIDLVEPDCDYNVAFYQRDVERVLQKLGRGIRTPSLEKEQRDYQGGDMISPPDLKIPFLVGGTGLYINTVIDNWQLPPGEPDLKLRQELESQIERDGLETVWDQLIKLDPGCAEFVQSKNPRRVGRALEYVLSTGQKFSASRGCGEPQFDVLKIGVNRDRAELYQRIDERVDDRVKLGMIEEVALLHQERGLSWERLGRFGLEYRVIGEYLEARSLAMGVRSQKSEVRDTIKEMSQRLKWKIHAYARRQLTWFRRDKEIQWVEGVDQARKLVEGFI